MTKGRYGGMKRNAAICTLALTVILVSVFFVSRLLFAQGWTALPPYNVLWPLWSPALSPLDPVTGAPTPLVTTLNKNTFLPVQPALVWDPALPYFYLLYNYIPTYGDPVLKYFDPLEGFVSAFTSFKTWPPTYMQTAVTTATGTSIVPAPIPLPLGYQTLYTFDPAAWLNFWVPLVNPFWQNYYGINPALLTAAQLLNPALTFTGTYL